MARSPFSPGTGHCSCSEWLVLQKAESSKSATTTIKRLPVSKSDLILAVYSFLDEASGVFTMLPRVAKGSLSRHHSEAEPARSHHSPGGKKGQLRFLTDHHDPDYFLGRCLNSPPRKGRAYYSFGLSYAIGHSFDEAQIKFCVLKCSHSVYLWHPSSNSKHLCIWPKNYILNIWLRTKVGCLETPLKVCGELQISQQWLEEARSDVSLWEQLILFSAWRWSSASLLRVSMICGESLDLFFL